MLLSVEQVLQKGQLKLHARLVPCVMHLSALGTA